MSAKKDKVIQDIKAGINSSEEVLVMSALNKMESKGDSSLIPDMIVVWSESESQPVKQKIENLLFGLKDKAALNVLIDFLKTNTEETQNWLALNAIWQSGFDASQHLAALVQFAMNNSYTNAIDVMTIIMNSAFDESQDDLVDETIKNINQRIISQKSELDTILMEIKSILVDKKIEG